MSSVSIQSGAHEELLNVIDELRSKGVSRYIDLPQIIVCGDQSSGKSSVLEALSGLRFPTKDNLCTRFATELILRRGAESKLVVTIFPGGKRTHAEQRQLRGFKLPHASLENFEGIVDAAEKAMGLDTNVNAFSQDILRVEVSGPKEPHLTLVDLPGLFHSGNKSQSETDATAVKDLVLSYMEKSRSIILAVISAKNDYANQIVTSYARKVDPLGNRTLGIISKPDMLHPGSESERAFIELAENKDVNFRLGWHVLKNRDYDSRNSSTAERDEAEKKFFATGIWASLSPNVVGIGALKPRLSQVLKEQILLELPGLIREVASRTNLQEQQLYLLRLSQSFISLTDAAINGLYVDKFFGDPKSPQGYCKRLRAVVQNRLTEFAKTMEAQGHSVTIVDSLSENIDSNLPRKILREEFLENAKDLMQRTRGCEVSSVFNPQIIGELFYEQSKPWKRLLKSCMVELLDSAKTAIDLVLSHAADSTTREGVLRYIIDPAMEPIKHALEENARSMLEHHERGHPITYNNDLIIKLQKLKSARKRRAIAKTLETQFGVDTTSKTSRIKREFYVHELLDELCREKDPHMDLYAANEACETMEAYYEVAMKQLIDDFSVHSIERCLLKRLPGIFSPEIVVGLDNETVETIAAESLESRAERRSLTEKVKVLDSTLTMLHRLDRHKPKVLHLKRSSSEAGF